MKGHLRPVRAASYQEFRPGHAWEPGDMILLQTEAAQPDPRPQGTITVNLDGTLAVYNGDPSTATPRPSVRPWC
jgi:hypothetical protein